MIIVVRLIANVVGDFSRADSQPYRLHKFGSRGGGLRGPFLNQDCEAVCTRAKAAFFGGGVCQFKGIYKHACAVFSTLGLRVTAVYDTRTVSPPVTLSSTQSIHV